MKLYHLVPFLTLTAGMGLAPKGQETAPEKDAGSPLVHSEVIATAEGGLVLSQSFVVEAPVKEVWNAYVTEEGWTSWSSPHATIDLRPGGTIRTHYGKDAKVGDPGTITLHIVNYVPERVLTLRPELADHFPEIMKEDDGNLMEMTLFEPLSEDRTRVTAYGMGYRDLPEYRKLIEFFEPANAGLYRKLKATLEARHK